MHRGTCRTGIVVALTLLLTSTGTVFGAQAAAGSGSARSAQAPAQPQPATPAPPAAGGLPNADDISPDRPDVTNGARILDVGLAQLEIGGLHAVEGTSHTTGTPVTLRIGLTDWLEARVGGDGWLFQSDQGATANGPGNVQLAAKIRLLADADGAPLLAVLPTVNVPVASAEKGLGSGSADYTLLVISGVDFGPRTHVDVNYGIGAIGAGEGEPRFAQHLLSASGSYQVNEKFNPYAEVFWFSRNDPDGDPAHGVDVGFIYTLTPRVAVDAGIQAGLSNAATDVSVFGGISFVLGDVLGQHGVQARQRRANKRAGLGR